MSLVTGVGAVAFVLSTGFALWFGSMQVSVAPQPIYPYSLEDTPAGAVADLASLLHAYLFVFASGLLGYGWLGVPAMALEGAKYANLLLNERMAATEFFFALPQFLGLAGAAVFSQALAAQASERKKRMLLGAGSSVGGLALLMAFYVARGIFIQ